MHDLEGFQYMKITSPLDPLSRGFLTFEGWCRSSVSVVRDWALSGASFLWKGASRAMAATFDSSSRWDAEVVGNRVFRTDGKEHASFEIVVTLGVHRVTTWRRFSEFRTLHGKVRTGASVESLFSALLFGLLVAHHSFLLHACTYYAAKYGIPHTRPP
jgi:hypothetical protein